MWATPQAFFDKMNKEFHFNLDVDREMGKESIRKRLRGDCIVVCLLPARTDTRWFQDYCLKSKDIRFVRGRLHFNESKQGAPFPSCVVVFSPSSLGLEEDSYS